MGFLIGLILVLLVLIIIIVFIYLYAKKKVSKFLVDNFNTNSLSEAIEKSNIEAETTPKSLSSMESIYLPKIKKDFPGLNINELKSKAESVILKTIDGIEKRDVDTFKEYEKINAYIVSRITDAENTNTHYTSAKIHKTVINKYEKTGGIATIYFQSSFEYTKKVGDDRSKVVQSRMNSEFIYVIDESKVSKNEKTIGLNCPNCGAPLKGVGQRVCYYCGSGTEDIVKRTWTINNIAEFSGGKIWD